MLKKLAQEWNLRHSGNYDTTMLTPVDPEQLAFLASPWPTAIILTTYLVFVLKVGPSFMECRKPFDLRGIIKAYNILQILYNGSLVVGVSIGMEWRDAGRTSL